MGLKAFHSDRKIKAKYLRRVRAHQKADEIIKGVFWKNGRGCAVGCTIHSSEHKAYETELGIPEWLARVEDTIFEGLPLDRAKLWPQQFLSSTKVGANLEAVKNPFLVFVLQSALNQVDKAKLPEAAAAIKEVIRLRASNVPESDPQYRAASDAAYVASYVATEAAFYAAYVVTEAALYAASDATEAAYVSFADELLRLLKEAV